MNPLRSHWFRLAAWLLLASPIVALLAALDAHADFRFVLSVTLSVWAVVCIVLALIALGGLLVRVGARLVRTLRHRGGADVARHPR